MPDRQPMTFEFEGKPPRLGVPVVNGHKIMTATSFDVHMSFDALPVVTLTLCPADALGLILKDKAMIVKVGDETREALISLGWTPPSDSS